MFFVGFILGLFFVTPLVVIYALLVRWCDRFEPEPWWLLFAAFLWGAIFATLGGGISSGIGEAIATNLVGANANDPEIQAFGATVLAPIFEEGFKGFGVVLIVLVSALGLREFDGALDGAIYGGIIGLGFTLTEDILYVSGQFAENGIVGFFDLFFIRTVLLGLSHCTFTACTGLGFGIAVESRRPLVKIAAPIGGYLLAVCMHAFHNALPTFFGNAGAVMMILITWFIVLLFFVLLAFLVARDRAIVIRELTSEVGALIHPRELVLVTTYITLGWRNWAVLLSQGWREFSARRNKQLALVELAFIKNRRRRGERGRGLDMKEAKLRHDVYVANQRGVWIGN